MIKIIQGADKDITVKLTDDATQDPYNLSGVSEIRACFIKKDNTSLHIFHLAKTGDTVSGSDIVTLNVTNISEGDPISGAGIPSGSTVLKTPTSSTSPSASGTVKISANATATASAVALTIGHVSVASAIYGKIKISLNEDHSDSLDSGTQGFEVRVVKSGRTSYVQFPESLEVIERLC